MDMVIWSMVVEFIVLSCQRSYRKMPELHQPGTGQKLTSRGPKMPGSTHPTQFSDGDVRGTIPRFTAENRAANQAQRGEN